MTDCLFCKIAEKNVASEIVYENNDAVAFLDIHPCASGHTVIIPKIHSETLSEMADAVIGPFWAAVRSVSNMLSEALHPDGLTIGINQGRAAGQAIDHMHVHIIPRWQDDGGGSIHSIVQNSPTESISTIAEKIKNTRKNNGN